MAELDNMNINELRAERNRHIIAAAYELTTQQVDSIIRKSEEGGEA
jgi:hypothetical protein